MIDSLWIKNPVFLLRYFVQFHLDLELSFQLPKCSDNHNLVLKVTNILGNHLLFFLNVPRPLFWKGQLSFVIKHHTHTKHCVSHVIQEQEETKTLWCLWNNYASDRFVILQYLYDFNWLFLTSICSFRLCTISWQKQNKCWLLFIGETDVVS